MPAPELIFLHGYESSGHGFKAEYLRKIFPSIHTPTFTGELEERMSQLEPIFSQHDSWIIIGSSYGGLMAAVIAARYPTKVVRMVLLAPALVPGLLPPTFVQDPPVQIHCPTIIIHGRLDTVVSPELVKPMAARTFSDLDYRDVDDDHRLHATTEALDWPILVGLPVG
jgi:pimeloyl-ACP methyl ester carboxylesterase